MAMFYQIRSEFDFLHGLKGGQLTPFLATLNPKLSNVPPPHTHTRTLFRGIVILVVPLHCLTHFATPESGVVLSINPATNLGYKLLILH